MSGHSTIQLSYISSASTCAGVAATAGELAKEQKHRDSAEETKCDFIPLVVETFGVWLAFTLRIQTSGFILGMGGGGICHLLETACPPLGFILSVQEYILIISNVVECTLL